MRLAVDVPGTLIDVRSIPVLLLLAVLAAACSGGGASVAGGEAPVRIGASPEAESRLLAEILRELLSAADVPAEVEEFANAGDARQAIELGAVDVSPAYTGEAWLEVLGRADPPSDPRTSFARVRAADEPGGIHWLRPGFGAAPRAADAFATPPANGTFAFVVQEGGAGGELTTMAQLARRLAERPDALVCVDPEFGTRPDGLPAVLDAYRVPYQPDDQDRFVAAGPEDAVLGVAAGDCVAGLTTATDGEAWRHGLRPLVDDLGVFPAFVVTAQHTDELLQERPEAVAAISPLPAHLTTRLLGGWNARVAAGEPLELVAADAAALLLERAGDLPGSGVGAG